MLLLRLLLVWTLLWLPLSAGAAELVVEFLDVGQGAAVLVTSPAGKRMLVDAGPPEAGATVAAALRNRGVSALDLAVVGHPHLDHVGGFPDALRVAPAKRVLDPGIAHPIRTYQQLLESWQRDGVPMVRASAGRSIDLGGGARAEILGPPAEHLKSKRSDVNANSVILLLRLGERSILLTGDAEPETERWLLQHHREALRADVLQVAHHGSRHSSSRAFLAAVAPGHAVISSGRKNDYGHPHGQVLERLGAQKAKVWRTDQQGTVRVVTDGKALRVEALGRERVPEPGVVGSRRSEVYHLPGCTNAAKILPRNRVGWPDAAAAEAEGRRPARDCLAQPAEGR